MTKRQQNSHRMHAAVLNLFDRRPEVWAGKPAAVETVGRLQGLFDTTAETEAERQRLGTKGLTARKAAARDAMEAAAMRLVYAARPYARVTGDDVLLAEVDVSASALDLLSDEAVLNRTGRVLAAVEGRVAEMAGYGATKEGVEALRAATAVVKPAGAVRDSTGGQREARVEALGPLFPGDHRGPARARRRGQEHRRGRRVPGRVPARAANGRLVTP